jgi:hypothetical protein
MSDFVSGQARLPRQRSQARRLIRHVLLTAPAVLIGVALPFCSIGIGTALAHAQQRTTPPAEAMGMLAQPSAEISHPASLQAFARALRHAPVRVTCVTSTVRWLQLASGDVLGYVNSSEPLDVFLGPDVCRSAADVFRQPGIVTLDRAVAIQVLVHELVHTTGLFDERQAETISFTLLRSTLVRFLGYSRAGASAMDAYAWRYHLGRNAAYQLSGPRRYAPWPA